MQEYEYEYSDELQFSSVSYLNYYSKCPIRLLDLDLVRFTAFLLVRFL